MLMRHNRLKKEGKIKEADKKAKETSRAPEAKAKEAAKPAAKPKKSG